MRDQPGETDGIEAGKKTVLGDHETSRPADNDLATA
jgi:hypothetical protein